MLGGFTPMVDSAQSKNKRILQVAAWIYRHDSK